MIQMECYIEITLLPSGDITPYFLWEKVYQQIHLALVEVQDANKKVEIGVAFPEYNSEKNYLGSKLRLFSPSNEVLENLKITEWLSRLTDYVHITKIRDVPKKVEKYACFKRVQLKNNSMSLARRKAKRMSMSIEQAIACFNGNKESNIKAPFINVKSLSSDKKYRLMIVRTDVENSQIRDGFSTYGLSSRSSVPVF